MTTTSEAPCMHIASANPRHQGACVKCGRPIPADPHLVRNLEFERACASAYARRAGVAFDLPTLQADRLARGSAEYGDTSFFGKSPRRLINEIREEAVDGCAWLTLVQEQLLYAPLDDGQRERLTAIAEEIGALFALAHHRSTEFLDELGG